MKNFNFISALLFAVNFLIINATVTFRVIAIDGTPSVVIGNQKYAMKVEQYPVYTVTVNNVNSPVDYHYALGSQEESFTRTTNADTTLNEFFDRPVTVKKTPNFTKGL